MIANERERKFLVKTPYFLLNNELVFNDITQLYLNEECTSRIRQEIRYPSRLPDYFIKKFTVTCKTYLNKTDRVEHEFSITEDEFMNIYKQKLYKYILQKKRAKLDGWEIDVYPSGLIVAEYEFDENNPIPNPLPTWIDIEITGVDEYSNIYIAKNWENLNN